MLRRKYKDFIKILPGLYFDWIKGLRNAKKEMARNQACRLISAFTDEIRSKTSLLLHLKSKYGRCLFILYEMKKME